MRRHYGCCSLAILCGMFSSSVHAADTTLTPVGNPPVFRSVILTPANPATPKSQNGTTAKPTSAAPTFADRMKAAQQSQLQQQQADDSRPKPTNWQIQNPSNPQNNTPTVMPQSLTSNNYFGRQFDAWSNVSQPPPMTQLPFNQTAVPAINQTNLYVAPNNYFGTQNANWNSLRVPQPEMNPFGGWNYR